MKTLKPNWVLRGESSGPLVPIMDQSTEMLKIPIPSNGRAPPKMLVTSGFLGKVKQKTLMAWKAGLIYVGKTSSALHVHHNLKIISLDSIGVKSVRPSKTYV
jgi:hypothetical protein